MCVCVLVVISFTVFFFADFPAAAFTDCVHTFLEFFLEIYHNLGTFFDRAIASFSPNFSMLSTWIPIGLKNAIDDYSPFSKKKNTKNSSNRGKWFYFFYFLCGGGWVDENLCLVYFSIFLKNPQNWFMIFIVILVDVISVVVVFGFWLFQLNRHPSDVACSW